MSNFGPVEAGHFGPISGVGCKITICLGESFWPDLFDLGKQISY